MRSRETHAQHRTPGQLYALGLRTAKLEGLTFSNLLDYKHIMDLYFLLSLFGTLPLVLSADLVLIEPTVSSTRSSGRGHLRTKRCSCATFLDKECVYFCHLDIIWVNTPERVVSYGLGIALRTKRSLQGPEKMFRRAQKTGWNGPRCQCERHNDRTCINFCHRKQKQHGSEKLLSVHRRQRSKDKSKQRLPLKHVQSITHMQTKRFPLVETG